MSLADALERVAEAMPDLADVIRPANGDPDRLIENLDGQQVSDVLVWMLGEAPEDAAELAAEWAAHDAGIAALSGIEESRLPKAGRKTLRRVRHRLRSQGIALPDAPVAAKVATLPELEADVEGAFVSPIDPSGSRAVVLVQPHPAGGSRIFELVTNEILGIRRCDVYKAPRGKARRFLREATQATDGAGVDVPIDAARVLVARAAAAQPTNRSMPRTFSEWRSQIADAPDGTATPGDLVVAALGDPAAEDQAKLLEILGEGLMGPWPPAEEVLRATAEQLSEARETKIVVSGGTLKERFEEILANAAETTYDEGFSEVTAARFEESAYVFWKMGREDEARACLAGAQAFRTGEARSNPVARALLGRLLAPLLKEEEKEESEESESLLVKP